MPGSRKKKFAVSIKRKYTVVTPGTQMDSKWQDRYDAMKYRMKRRLEEREKVN